VEHVLGVAEIQLLKKFSHLWMLVGKRFYNRKSNSCATKN